MLKIKEILRLKYEARLSNRRIARALNISHSVVNGYIKEFQLTQRSYEDIGLLNDKEILALFKTTRATKSLYPLPDFAKCLFYGIRQGFMRRMFVEKIVPTI